MPSKSCSGAKCNAVVMTGEEPWRPERMSHLWDVWKFTWQEYESHRDRQEMRTENCQRALNAKLRTYT